MNNTTTPQLTLDAIDAVELAEICELVDAWLGADPDAAASYDRYIGHGGQAGELRTVLRHHARALGANPEGGR